jgi:DNA polymerase V
MFFGLEGLGSNVIEQCRQARAAVLRETKIPTCIGIGETKTKAKLANFIAKKRPAFEGVCDLRNAAACAALYPTIPLDEVWGIGRASVRKLRALGFETVVDLAACNVRQSRNLLTVTGARVIMELQGTCCLPLSLVAPPRKGLAVTRTFGRAVLEWDEFAKAIATFATRAGEKLRGHGLLATCMTVFIQTNRFGAGEYYSNPASFGIEPTQDSLSLVRDALRGARPIFRKGYRYWKAGVMLNDLVAARRAPAQMFPARDPQKFARLISAMDSLNGRFGRGMVRPAVAGVERRWTAKTEYLSRRYTTRVKELVTVRA